MCAAARRDVMRCPGESRPQGLRWWLKHERRLRETGTPGPGYPSRRSGSGGVPSTDDDPFVGARGPRRPEGSMWRAPARPASRLLQSVAPVMWEKIALSDDIGDGVLLKAEFGAPIKPARID